jgi:hypothetical protein
MSRRLALLSAVVLCTVLCGVAAVVGVDRGVSATASTAAVSPAEAALADVLRDEPDLKPILAVVRMDFGSQPVRVDVLAESEPS